MSESRPLRIGARLASTALLAALVLATTVPAIAATPRCGGQDATIVGTDQGETIRGTAGNDVIVARGGNDIIRGGGGQDIICGDGGDDRIYGQAGKDRLYGKTGDDQLYGGAGADLLAGQAGNDRLDGGLGTDTCYQAGGSGALLSCELPSAAPTPGRILAIAYTNLDLVPGFDPAVDVLIAKLVDVDGNGPGPGDQVVMGSYPTKLDPGPTDFAPWRVTLHTATSVDEGSAQLRAHTTAGFHVWDDTVNGQSMYIEEGGAGKRSEVKDGTHAVDDVPGYVSEVILIAADSPSRPGRNLVAYAYDPGDSYFIDVDLFP